MKNGQNMKLIIVGFGRQARTDHLPVIESNPNIDLVGVLDPYFNESCGVPVFKDVDSLDNSKLDYDSVLISVPHDLHFNNRSDEIYFDLDAFRVKLTGYLDWYNNKRPHASLGYLSPMQFINSNFPESMCL